MYPDIRNQKYKSLEAVLIKNKNEDDNNSTYVSNRYKSKSNFTPFTQITKSYLNICQNV